jgi:hypothetical protein
MSPVKVSGSISAYFSAQLFIGQWCDGNAPDTLRRRSGAVLASFCARTSVMSEERPGLQMLIVVHGSTRSFALAASTRPSARCFGLLEALAHDRAAENGHGIKSGKEREEPRNRDEQRRQKVTCSLMSLSFRTAREVPPRWFPRSSRRLLFKIRLNRRE